AEYSQPAWPPVPLAIGLMSTAEMHWPAWHIPLLELHMVPSATLVNCMHAAGSLGAAQTPIDTQRLMVRSAYVRHSLESAPQAMVMQAASSPLLGKALHLAAP